ncbi:hypothetical protein COLO4_18389 [Corchorus olitorius]|uniref:Uncharacterized protein n=1 Tax=Corchorus olitorius TaxID=93759 RepID=A0A1R3J996_9ROSI|nr:hypothetical protein COLO4_18389 [Corchorus olitorius]
MAHRSASVALAPEAPYAAAGTMAGPVDLSFNSSADLEIFKLEFRNDDRELPVVGDCFKSERFNRLPWASRADDGKICIWDLAAPALPCHFLPLKGSGSAAQVVWDSKKQKPWYPDVATQHVASDEDGSPALSLWDMQNIMSLVEEFVGHTKGISDYIYKECRSEILFSNLLRDLLKLVFWFSNKLKRHELESFYRSDFKEGLSGIQTFSDALNSSLLHFVTMGRRRLLHTLVASSLWHHQVAANTLGSFTLLIVFVLRGLIVANAAKELGIPNI